MAKATAARSHLLALTFLSATHPNSESSIGVNVKRPAGQAR
jgi:hypothetical protein